MTKYKGLLLFFGRMAAMPALLLWMFFSGFQTTYAATTEYNLFIGDTRVTSDNADNIFGENGTDGNPTARYDAGTKTLYLNGVNIDADHYYPGSGTEFDLVGAGWEEAKFSMGAGTDVVKNLVITDYNTFVSEGVTESGMEVGENDYDFAWHNGIRFSVSSGSTFTINGTGTLTSTSISPTNEATGEKYGVAMTVAVEDGAWLKIGNEDGTGPTLDLTGWRMGANFTGGGKFAMQGGTVIAKAANPNKEASVGVFLPNSDKFFEGGTIVAYGAELGFNNCIDTHFDTGDAERVYPATSSGDTAAEKPVNNISGWCVVGVPGSAGTRNVVEALALTGSAGEDDPGTAGLSDENNPGTEENNRYHTDIVPDESVAIDVLGFTEDATVYSVDVEWGAMTFVYESSTWDSATHKQKDGAGWVVYDSANDEVLDAKHDAINRVTITNYSNAAVYAKPVFTPVTAFSGIKGVFTASEAADTGDVKATWNDTDKYLTLKTADTDENDVEITGDAEGKPSVGNMYFMPKDIDESVKTSGITKWEKIGKITVSLLTKEPTAGAAP